VLALTFPSLRRAEGIVPWDPQRLWRWASRGTTSFEASAAAEFILALAGADFLGSDLASLTRLLCAFSTWSDGDRAAFFAWARAPWWPGRPAAQLTARQE